MVSRSGHSERTPSERVANSGWLKHSLALECLRTCAISGAFIRLLTGTAIKPALKHAKYSLTRSMELHQWSATRSLGSSRLLKSLCARASVDWFSASYETTCSPQMTAGL